MNQAYTLANALLEEYLDPDQLADYRESSSFVVRTGWWGGRRSYRIMLGRGSGVSVYVYSSRVGFSRLCWNTRHAVPQPDEALSMLLFIRAHPWRMWRQSRWGY